MKAIILGFASWLFSTILALVQFVKFFFSWECFLASPAWVTLLGCMHHPLPPSKETTQGKTWSCIFLYSTVYGSTWKIVGNKNMCRVRSNSPKFSKIRLGISLLFYFRDFNRKLSNTFCYLNIIFLDSMPFIFDRKFYKCCLAASYYFNVSIPTAIQA